MRLSRKYPIFLLATTICTALLIFLSLLEVLRSSIEREMTKRGEMAAESFALAHGPLMLAFDKPKEKAQIRYSLFALATDPDFVAARIADRRGKVVAAIDPKQLGAMLPSYLTENNRESAYHDSEMQAYHFAATIQYGGVFLGTFVLSLSEEPLNTALTRARNRATAFATAVAAAVFALGMVFVRREVLPLQAMSRSLRSIGEGDFSHRISETRKDEIGDLSRAFNWMLARTELFMHYVDKMIIERLVEDESLSEPGGREQELVVAFGDMRGYTSMSNRRTANEVVRIVNTYFHLFIECIAHFRGIVDKTMGDAIMAIFELQNDADGEADPYAHARQGVLATAYMKAASRVLNRFLLMGDRESVGSDLEAREFGFAIATGTAIIGNIGSRRRMDYTVCGRVVNLASRLEGLTKSGEVIIDNFSRMGVGDTVIYKALPPVQPKGYREDEKVTPHRITNLSHAEGIKLREFMREIFTYSFVHDMLMPKDIPASEERAWCNSAHATLIGIINNTPISDFFALANTETGELIPPEPEDLYQQKA